MTLMQIIGLAVNASMFLIVFALGLQSKFDHVTYLSRHPRLFFRSILAMNVVMLLFAIGVIMLFERPPPVQIALVALAVSPVPPVLPGKQFQAGGSPGYTIGLLAGAAIGSIVFVPLVIEAMGRIFSVDMHEPIAKVASVVLISVVIPLVAGITLRRFAPALRAASRRDRALLLEEHREAVLRDAKADQRNRGAQVREMRTLVGEVRAQVGKARASHRELRAVLREQRRDRAVVLACDRLGDVVRKTGTTAGRLPVRLVIDRAACYSVRSSSWCQLSSGSNFFIAVAAAVVPLPRSFSNTIPSWLIMKVMTPVCP
jgi:hypothetical protein